MIEVEWIEHVVRNPVKEITQQDHKTVHAFFDRSFVP